MVGLGPVKRTQIFFFRVYMPVSLPEKIHLSLAKCLSNVTFGVTNDRILKIGPAKVCPPISDRANTA